MQVIDGLQLDVEEVAHHPAVRVGSVADRRRTGGRHKRRPASPAARHSSLLLANSMPLEAAWTCCSPPCGSRRRRQGSRARGSARRPENCTLICPLGLDGDGVSSMVLISSHVNSWTKPTWLASMKQGSHIMLQRLVRSMVSTEPRLRGSRLRCRGGAAFRALWAFMSRPGKLSFQGCFEEGRGPWTSHPQSAVAWDSPSPSGFVRRAQ